jgi:hypothetical protein
MGINPRHAIPGLAVNFLGCYRMQSHDVRRAAEHSAKEAPRFFAANQDTVVVIDRCVLPLYVL